MKFSIHSIVQVLNSKSIKEVLVIEIVQAKDTNAKVNYNAIAVELKNNDLNVIAYTRENNLDDINKWSKKNIRLDTPILILVNSNKILYKEVEGNIEPSPNQISTYFSTYDKQTFYYQISPLPNGRYAICLCRKSYIDNYLNEIEILNRNVIYVSVGPYHILNTYKHILTENSNDYSLATADYSLIVTTDETLQYSLNNICNEELLSSSYLLNGSLPKHHVFAYSLATTFFLKISSTPCLNIESVSANREKAIFNKRVKWLLWRGALIIIILLIISNISFSIYNSKYTQLHAQYKTALSLTDSQRKEIELYDSKIKTLIDNGLILEQTITSLSDQITKNLHENIYIRKLQIHPEKQTSMQDISFDQNTIYIEGNCYSSIDLNEWIVQLNNITWVKTINIVEYNKGDILSEFKIKISK